MDMFVAIYIYARCFDAHDTGLKRVVVVEHAVVEKGYYICTYTVYIWIWMWICGCSYKQGVIIISSISNHHTHDDSAHTTQAQRESS